MVVIRPIAWKDLDRLIELASQAGFGLTTLPNDPAFLRRRIRESLRAFEPTDEERPNGETYLFVMENLETGRVVGTSAIASKVGGFEPFYAFRLETSVHESKQLGIRKEIQVLRLVAEHNGPCVIGSLFLSPEQRGRGQGRLLSLARFLFMAERPARFDPMVAAEMRGIVDDEGRSPFWEALGRHFFEVDYTRADYLSAIDKRFIAALMPPHPFYVPLLPPEARAVIGQVHPQTRPALRLLEGEGFRPSGMVDIFEAGLIVTCPRDEIRTARESRRATVEGFLDRNVSSETHLISNVSLDYRACQGPVEWASPEAVLLSRAVGEALGLKLGDQARVVPIRPATAREDVHG
ncbi:MAG: arginine N-succinyltransferase [Candidatus Sumerlaeota bacterium]|nr:arginine N-succinyltransferase [Candidatus Sumerlaeota bacterium]